jgi:hypothetical protein
MNGLSDSYRVVSALAASTNITEVVPHDPWDVRCDVILSPDKTIELADPAVLPGIKWESLALERIKRIAPLWHLNKARK